MPIIFSFVMIFLTWGITLTLVLYKPLNEKFIKKHYRLSRRKNILFSNWKRRHVNPIKGTKFKRERRLASSISHYFFFNGLLGLASYFFLNPATFLFCLLIITILSYIFLIIYGAINSAISVLNTQAFASEYWCSILIKSYLPESINKKNIKETLIILWSIFNYKTNFAIWHLCCGLFLLLCNITPKGVHPLMCVLLVPVELISILIRPISLAVRMFANLVMGHIMIAGLNFVTAYPCGGWWVWSGISTVLSSYLYLFELIVFIAQNMIFLYLYTTYTEGVNEVH